MRFTSIDFIIFFILVFALYWAVLNKRLLFQNIFIVCSSYIFYVWLDWRFLLPLAFITGINYYWGWGMQKSQHGKRRKILLWLGVISNLIVLGYFKYFNFFIDSFSSLISVFDANAARTSLSIILPAGISFYIFRAISYLIDIYRRDLDPPKDFIAFAAFMSFFPLLLCGPIERATHLLPQFRRVRAFDYSGSVDGLRQILWGLFKKIIIADNCSIYAGRIINDFSHYHSGALMLGALFFSVQIYADFSGYSDMAIGISRLLGFDVRQNFNMPYFSKNLTDFWRRWHISLSSWLRDYLFAPMSVTLRSWGKAGIILSLMCTFILCGFWHGPDWTFIIWGALHGLALVWDVLTNKLRQRIRKRTNEWIYNFFSRIITFSFVTFAWIFFMLKSVSDAFSYIWKMLSGLFTKSSMLEIYNYIFWGDRYIILSIIIAAFIAEWLQRNRNHALQIESIRLPRVWRWSIYYLIIILIFWFGNSPQEFVYFQF